MKKWLKVGAALMLAAWLPFLYNELTSEPPEPKGRVLPTDDGTDTAAEGEPVPEEPAEPEDEPQVADPAAQVPAAAPGAPEAKVAEPAAAPTAAVAPGEPGAVAEPPPAAPQGEADESEPEGEVEGEPEPLPPTAQGPIPALRAAFESQPRDALWAGDLEHKLKTLFGTADVPQALLSSASCRKAVCRLSLAWTPDRATAYVAVYEAAKRLSGTEIAVEPAGAADAQGAQPVHLYLSRQGYTVADQSR